MAAPLQLGFTDYEQIYAKKRTRRQRFQQRQTPLQSRDMMGGTVH